MKETSVDLWIKDFIELTDTQFERFEQAIKSERGFWLYDIREKKIYLSDGVVYLTIQSENIEDYVKKLMAENEFIHLLNLAKESVENKQNGFSIRIKLEEGRWIFVCATILYKKGIPFRIVGTFEDVTPHVSCDLRLNRYIELIAYYDDVTGLPNRNFLNEKIRERIEKSKKEN